MILAKFIKHVRIWHLTTFIGLMVICLKKKDCVCLIVLYMNYLFVKPI